MKNDRSKCHVASGRLTWFLLYLYFAFTIVFICCHLKKNYKNFLSCNYYYLYCPICTVKYAVSISYGLNCSKTTSRNKKKMEKWLSYKGKPCRVMHLLDFFANHVDIWCTRWQYTQLSLSLLCNLFSSHVVLDTFLGQACCNISWGYLNIRCKGKLTLVGPGSLQVKSSWDSPHWCWKSCPRLGGGRSND